MLQLTLQAPLQVILQVPEAHATVEPEPTINVHDVPAQATVEWEPAFPVQVDPAPHVTVALSESSPKSQLAFMHPQTLLLQILRVQLAIAVSENANAKRVLRSVRVMVSVPLLHVARPAVVIGA
jgi:hypothetical protein